MAWIASCAIIVVLAEAAVYVVPWADKNVYPSLVDPYFHLVDWGFQAVP